MRVRILGIDPGIAIVGFGLIEADRGKTRLLNYGAITTPAGLPLARRLVQIEQDMEALIAQLKPNAIAVEELFFSNKQAVVGYGLAEKRQVMDMVKRLLKLKAVPRPDDAADALAIAICHARSATSLLSRVGGNDVKQTI